ncbi:MAG: uncharacterized protein KVP18_001092 [Porospora cf. gigantea A]|uniref:uncharacterized protein n=1 Tax=Porospora cf. gigantea A TaxID=2853593 RepID=UPI003559611C|nr:MAG: hypothetical protein KVP18_001092 [Porospora cf. gigantea A]
MGGIISAISGLDNAGKTTILFRLQVDDVVHTVPTIGFNLEVVQYKNIKFQVWDLGGQTTIRPYWRCYYPNTNAVVFVVDSADRNRMDDARVELHLILEEEELKGVALLVFANKQELAEAMTVVDVAEALKLHNIRDRQWNICPCSAIKGTGITEGFDWMYNELRQSR